MGFSDEQIRDMLELKEDLAEKIIKYKEQIEKLEKNYWNGLHKKASLIFILRLKSRDLQKLTFKK